MTVMVMMMMVVVALADEDHDCGDAYDIFWQAIDTIINITCIYIYISTDSLYI